MLPSELLADPKRWTQHVFARDKDGHSVCPTEDGAVVGVYVVLWLKYQPLIFIYVCEQLMVCMKSKGIKPYPTIFNDKSTHEEVLQLLKDAGL
jgi:hypothetical protein